MKITVRTVLAAASLAFAPIAQAQEGNGDPFPFSAGPIGVVQFVDGVAVALPGQPAPAYAARGVTSRQPTAEVAELPAGRRLAQNYAPSR